MRSEGRAAEITLLSTINRNYWPPFEVLAASLLHARQEATTVEWHVVTDEDPGDWGGWLARMNATYASVNASFVLHRLREQTDVELPLRGRARRIMYARLLAPGQLADRCGRLLYLDADMLVLRPVEELWASDLGPHVCACCQDLAVPTVSSGMAIRGHGGLGLRPDAPYFNAGVMLIDTARWQAAEVGERALAYLATHANAVNLFDQEALNAALAGRWQQVSCRWNLIASVAGRSFLDLRALDRDDYEASLRQPGIVHYAGTLKPWRNPFLRGRWFELYHDAVQRARPEHAYEPSIGHRAQAMYDAWLRDWAYPLERAVWEARRGF